MDDGRGRFPVSPEGERCEETSPGAQHGRWARLVSNQRPLACETCPGCCGLPPVTAVCAPARGIRAEGLASAAFCSVGCFQAVSRTETLIAYSRSPAASRASTGYFTANVPPQTH